MESNWKPMSEVPFAYKLNQKNIICKWKLPDGSILISSARWVAPNPSIASSLGL